MKRKFSQVKSKSEKESENQRKLTMNAKRPNSFASVAGNVGIVAERVETVYQMLHDIIVSQMRTYVLFNYCYLFLKLKDS